jgi:hypothetical protein
MTPESFAESLIALYNLGGPYTVEQLAAVYSNNIVFTDPAHSIVGLPALCAYLNHQYSNVKSCEFLLKDAWHSGSNLFLQWDMTVLHPKLNGGKAITVNGLSHLQYSLHSDNSATVFSHRDFFDLKKGLTS